MSIITFMQSRYNRQLCLTRRLHMHMQAQGHVGGSSVQEDCRVDLQSYCEVGYIADHQAAIQQYRAAAAEAAAGPTRAALS